MLTFRVDGDPRPQGSKAAKLIKGRIVMYESTKGLKEWRELVTACAREAAGADWVTIPKDTPVVLDVMFYFRKGKSIMRNWMTVPPDVDKLARAIGDALTDAGIWVDDSQIVSLNAGKYYGTPGVIIHIAVAE